MGGPVHERFQQFARRSSEFVGSAEVFLVTCGAHCRLGCDWPRYHYFDTRQLVINTATTIVTFLMAL